MTLSKNRILGSPEFQISIFFQFWAFRSRYHRFCEEFVKGNGTCPKLNFGREHDPASNRAPSWTRSEFLPSDSLFLAATV